MKKDISKIGRLVSLSPRRIKKVLYYIDESCAEALSNGDLEAAEFLEQLVIHRRKCKNMLIATRKVFAEFSGGVLPFLTSWSLIF